MPYMEWTDEDRRYWNKDEHAVLRRAVLELLNIANTPGNRVFDLEKWFHKYKDCLTNYGL